MKIHYARLFYWLSLSNGICSMSLVPGTVQFYGVVPINQTWRAGRVICCFFFFFPSFLNNSGNYLSKRDLNKFVEIKPSVVTPVSLGLTLYWSIRIKIQSNPLQAIFCTPSLCITTVPPLWDVDLLTQRSLPCSSSPLPVPSLIGEAHTGSGSLHEHLTHRNYCS